MQLPGFGRQPSHFCFGKSSKNQGRPIRSHQMRRTQVTEGRANSLCSNRARQFLGAFASRPGRQASVKGEKGWLEGA